MTDNNVWQPPSGPANPPPAGVAGAPAPTPSPYGVGAPQYGERLPGGAAPGWTPPPKPGLIPLRPLAFGTLLGAAFQVMRRNPRPTFGIALLLNGLVMLLLLYDFVQTLRYGEDYGQSEKGAAAALARKSLDDSRS